ncbi:hypothetical protein B0H16DRAFT_150689 [Mycena metata]|uniref:Uncharacterized protein n=1 Tax=Mycena metata TaxID=1033252 RepID=A0AAD7I4C4_9AGAR|nr:hypothetical protein B0H16DRAFT_150689 [Mycena metata]
MLAVLYGFSLAYLVAPDTAKYAGKVLLAAPFAFRGLNGIRHLSWDMGKCASRFCCDFLFCRFLFAVRLRSLRPASRLTLLGRDRPRSLRLVCFFVSTFPSFLPFPLPSFLPPIKSNANDPPRTCTKPATPSSRERPSPPSHWCFCSLIEEINVLLRFSSGSPVY